MVTSVNWPDGLRAMIDPGKTREVSPGFRISQPAAGAFYTERITDDVYHTFDFTFRGTRLESAVFLEWFKSPDYCDNGNNSFNMPVTVDSGDTVPNEVVFSPQGRPSLVSSDGDVNSYSCQVIVRSLDTGIPDGMALEFWGIYGSDASQLSSLDLAIGAWPTSSL